MFWVDRPWSNSAAIHYFWMSPNRRRILKPVVLHFSLKGGLGLYFGQGNCPPIQNLYHGSFLSNFPICFHAFGSLNLFLGFPSFLVHWEDRFFFDTFIGVPEGFLRGKFPTYSRTDQKMPQPRVVLKQKKLRLTHPIKSHIHGENWPKNGHSLTKKKNVSVREKTRSSGEKSARSSILGRFSYSVGGGGSPPVPGQPWA